MYDTLYLRLSKFDVLNVDFLSETPCYFSVDSTHDFSGKTVISGKLDNLAVNVSESGLSVKNSICKWFLSDNYQTMRRGDTKRAIEKLSDILHLPIDKAKVTRLDIAQNFIVKHPPEVYINHLGELRGATRLQERNGLYYSQSGGRLAFYDKNREQKSKHEPIPELYSDCNVLRYEMRFDSRVARQFEVSEVTAAMLYNEQFYIALLNRWRDNYRLIQKINDVQLNFEAMQTKQDLYKMGVLSLIERAGGQIQMLNQIAEAQKSGILTKKQAFDLRQTVNEACNIKNGLTVKSTAITELDKKVIEAVRYYR